MSGTHREALATATFEREDFERFVDAISATNSEGVIQLTDDGLYAEMTGVAYVMCVRAEAPYGVYGSGDYAHVERGTDEHREFGVDISELADGVESLPGSEGYCLNFHEEELEILSLGEGVTVPLIDQEDMMRNEYASPDDHVEYGIEFEPAAHRFKGVVGSISEAVVEGQGNAVVFSSGDDELSVRGFSDRDCNECDYDWSIPVEVSEMAWAEFSADYLVGITDVIPATADLSVKMGDDQPMRVQIGDWATFHLAGRIRDDREVDDE